MSWFRETPNQWSYKESIYINHESEPIRLVSNDDTVFAISTSDYNYQYKQISTYGIPQLSEYCHQDDEWIKYQITFELSSFPVYNDFCLSSDNAVAMFQNTIYLLNKAYTGSIILFQLDRKNHQCIIKLIQNDSLTKKIKQATTFGTCLLIPEREQIHIVGGLKFGGEQHIIYDINKKRITKEHNLIIETRFKIGCYVYKCGLVTIKNNKILMIGGRDGRINPMKDIHTYDIKTNEWENNAFNFDIFCNKNYHLTDSCVSIFNKSIVLIFNGYDKNIYIYDVIGSNKQFYISDIKCPVEDEENYQIFAINNDNETLKFLIWGYIRQFWNKHFTATENRFLPDYLIKIIYQYSINEWIHLFANCITCKEHYKMNAMDIVNNKTTISRSI